ncbi:imidazole glycerol phosphate synthase subunit HisF [candidate division KSB1 bacterium]|nr:imidazole glycerol phosphate synthase subunit HisF [candidate division KSB1 bacterium]
MLATRIIPCLDVDNGRVVKGIKFKNIRDAGDPVEMGKMYNEQGADELTFLDIGASYKSREIMIDVVEQVSRQIFIPFTVGGGIREVKGMREILKAGADKVAVCTAALKNPDLLNEGARIFGAQCIVLSIDAKRNGDSWTCYTHGGRNDTGKDVIEWAIEGEQRGAGEILLNSIDMDGMKEGYDLKLTRKVSESVNIPVIASGGAGTLQQMVDAVLEGKGDAVLLASLLHYGEFTIAEIKQYMKEKGVVIR